jgi:hypothetical protein
MGDGIAESETESVKNLRELPPLLSSLYDKLEDSCRQGEQKFRNKIYQIVRSQQKNIQDDMKTKLPQFYNRLFQKYT